MESRSFWICSVLPLCQRISCPLSSTFLVADGKGGHRSAGMYPWLSPLLATQGFLTVNISYRMSYQAVLPAQMYDVKAAVR
jgi:hypothetical protein